MRRKQLGMSPAKIAMAVAVTIEAIAGTGGMKKVTGTSSAVAIVAVRPGTAPTNRPNRAEAKITHSTYGSKTSANAAVKVSMALEGETLQHAPRQGDAQQLVEGEMDQQRSGDRHGYGERRAGAEHQRPGEHQQEAGEVKAKRLGQHNIECEPTQHADEADQRAWTAHPGAEAEPAIPGMQPPEYQCNAAGCKARGDEAGKQRRAEVLAGHGR